MSQPVSTSHGEARAKLHPCNVAVSGDLAGQYVGRPPPVRIRRVSVPYWWCSLSMYRPVYSSCLRQVQWTHSNAKKAVSTHVMCLQVAKCTSTSMHVHRSCISVIIVLAHSAKEGLQKFLHICFESDSTPQIQIHVVQRWSLHLRGGRVNPTTPFDPII